MRLFRARDRYKGNSVASMGKGRESKPTNENQLHNKSTLEDAFSLLSECRYVYPDGVDYDTDLHLSQSMRITSQEPLVRARREEYWGRPNPRSVNNFDIGWWGKVIALVLLRTALTHRGVGEAGPVMRESPALARDVVKEWQARKENKRLKSDQAAQLVIDLRHMFAFNKRQSKPARCPELGQGATAYQAVAWYFSKQISEHQRHDLSTIFNQQGLFEVLVDAEDDQAGSPEDFFWNLCDKLKIRSEVEASFRPTKQLVDKHLLPKAPSHDFGPSDNLTKIANEILDEFSRREAAPRIVGLSGDRHTGKKSVVAELLATLSGGENKFPTYRRPESEEPIPVIGFDLKTRNYYDLIGEVLARICESAGVPVPDSLLDLDDLLKEIARIHKDHAAFFIFVDVEGVSPQDPRRILQKRGIRRLLLTLRDSNQDSKFLLTSSEDTYLRSEPRFSCHWIDVPYPNIARLGWYLSADGAEKLQQLIFEEELDHLDTYLSGNGLLALAATVPESIAAYQTDFRKRVQNFINATREHGQDAGVSQAFDVLIASLKSTGILPAVALIALSHDGVGEYSLMRCLQWWFAREDSDHLLNPIDDGDAIYSELHSLQRAVRGLLLQHGPSLNHEPDEFGFDEPTGNTSKHGPNTWSMLPGVVSELLAAIARHKSDDLDGRVLMTNAKRTIAFAARRRAQFKKMRSQNDDPFFASDGVGRDVQSYLALMSSIDLDDLFTSEKEPLNPAQQLHRIFCLGSEFAPRLALVFCVQRILKHDIDLEDRLSMVTDQDALRLKLYLLPFVQFDGRGIDFALQARRDDRIFEDDLPKQVPDVLIDCLGKETVRDLLSTIAITAYYCLDNITLTWAAERLFDLSFDAISPESSPYIRLYLAMIDISLHRGEWCFADLDSRIFDEVNDWPAGMAGIEARLNALLSSKLGIDLENPLAQPSILKVWARFQVRRIEVSWYLNKDHQQLLQKLIQVDHAAGAASPAGTMLLISGRSARKLARVVADDQPILHLSDQSEVSHETKNLLRSLLETNISRLVRFAGAERVGVLLDRARLYIVERDPISRAQRVMSEAKRRADNGTISTAMRLELMALDASIEFAVLNELARSKRDGALQERLADLRDTVMSLHTGAEIMGMQTMVMFAKVLSLRCIYAFHEYLPSKQGWPANRSQRKSIIQELDELGMHRVALELERLARS